VQGHFNFLAFQVEFETTKLSKRRFSRDSCFPRSERIALLSHTFAPAAPRWWGWLINSSSPLCKIAISEKGLPPEFKTEDESWAALKAASLVRLKNESGVDGDTSQLPKTLEAMADDPYRSLVWFVPQKGGFCKSSRGFAEFAWADWFGLNFCRGSNKLLIVARS
jgi:hypothetical protein